MIFSLKQSIIYREVRDQNMSGMIDDIIFQTLGILQSTQKAAAEPTLVYEMFQRLKVIQRYPIVKSNRKQYQTHSTFDSAEKCFLVNLHVTKSTHNIKFTAVQVQEIVSNRKASKHNDLIKMRQCLKRHKELPAQANVYINNGRSYLIMNSFLPPSKQQKTSKIMEVYNSLFIKNLMKFQLFLKAYGEVKESRNQREQEKQNLFNMQLQLTGMLNTTHTTSNIAIDRSQFKSANSRFEKLKGQLNSIKGNIIQQICLQRSAPQLFQTVPEHVFTSWLKENYIAFYLKYQKTLNSVLTLLIDSPEKRLQDFVYNMVKVDLKEMIGGNRPLNEGGFSYIYGACADITFISSSDMKKLPQKAEKVEKFIAIKKLKQSELKKARKKLDHQKGIVIKMRGSTCQFLPKYYGTQKQSQFNNALVMELIKGEELDYYVSSRSQTMTIQSKLYLLTNLIQSIRHLINYRITHLDLKPINVIVTKSMVTKLIDFGQSYHPQLCPIDYMPGITFPYTAPEIIVRYVKLSFNKPDNDWQISEKQDAYAFGIIMYEMIFGGNIFSYTNNKFKDVYFKRQNLQRFFLAPQRVQDYGEDLMISHILYLIVRCMDPEPAKRPCFQWIGICLKLIQNRLTS